MKNLRTVKKRYGALVHSKVACSDWFEAGRGQPLRWLFQGYTENSAIRIDAKQYLGQDGFERLLLQPCRVQNHVDIQ